MPTGLTNVIAVAAGGDQSLALLSNGSVTNWGTNFGTMPANLTNIVAIAAGTNFCLALRSNSTVVAWGSNGSPTNVPAGLTNVVAIAAGGGHALALKVNGTVVAWGINSSGQTNVPSSLTNSTANAMGIGAGYAHSMALRNDGTLVEWGDNSLGQTNAPNLTRVKLIAAGGNQNLASTFSTLTQYQVDVTKDLLLIYNTNSTDSSNVWAYYMANRPMVTGANVLGIGCTNNETIIPSELPNQIFAPITNWLALNPTKRPQYVIIFPYIPLRVCDEVFTNWGSYSCCVDPEHPGLHPIQPGVGVQIRSLASGWRPFVNYLHFSVTNTDACFSYIDKLRRIGTNYSNGKLFISAANYGNSNYVIDDVHNGNFLSASQTNTVTALLVAGVASSNIIYSTDLVSPPGTHIYDATNVAGYFSFGTHCSLGPDFPINGTVRFHGNSDWYVINTYESYNGHLAHPDHSCIGRWFAASAFGGTNFSNIPVGGLGHCDESGVADSTSFFRFWALGKNLAISAWNSDVFSPHTIVVGDPLTTR